MWILAHQCPPPPIGNADQTLCANKIPILFRRFFFPVRTATPIGAGCIGAPIVLAVYKEDDRVRCASPIFKPIAYKLSFTNRKRKYFEEQTTATLKIKQTAIATVPNHILSVACFLTPLFFHYPLPLKSLKKGVGSGSISQRYGSEDLDPHQNVTNPQHWKLRKTFFFNGRNKVYLLILVHFHAPESGFRSHIQYGSGSRTAK